MIRNKAEFVPEVAERILRRIWIVWRRSGRKRLHAPLAVLRRRAASLIGAVLLSLFAIGFAASGDVAQHQFLRLYSAWPYLPLILTPAVFAAIAWTTRRFFPAASGSGIPQIIAASRYPAAPGNGPLVSIRTAAAKLAMTVAVLAVGGAAGREGPTVQTSAAVMVWVHKLFRVPITAGVIIAGGAAGVAAAFNTPLAGVAFAIEELAAALPARSVRRDRAARHGRLFRRRRPRAAHRGDHPLRDHRQSRHDHQ